MKGLWALGLELLGLGLLGLLCAPASAQAPAWPGSSESVRRVLAPLSEAVGVEGVPVADALEGLALPVVEPNAAPWEALGCDLYARWARGLAARWEADAERAPTGARRALRLRRLGWEAYLDARAALAERAAPLCAGDTDRTGQWLADQAEAERALAWLVSLEADCRLGDRVRAADARVTEASEAAARAEEAQMIAEVELETTRARAQQHQLEQRLQAEMTLFRERSLRQDVYLPRVRALELALPVTVQVEGQPAGRVLALLSEQSGVEIQAPAWDRPITLDVAQRPLEEVLDALAILTGSRWVYEELQRGRLLPTRDEPDSWEDEWDGAWEEWEEGETALPTWGRGPEWTEAPLPGVLGPGIRFVELEPPQTEGELEAWRLSPASPLAVAGGLRVAWAQVHEGPRWQARRVDPSEVQVTLSAARPGERWRVRVPDGPTGERFVELAFAPAGSSWVRDLTSLNETRAVTADTLGAWLDRNSTEAGVNLNASATLRPETEAVELLSLQAVQSPLAPRWAYPPDSVLEGLRSIARRHAGTWRLVGEVWWLHPDGQPWHQDLVEDPRAPPVAHVDGPPVSLLWQDVSLGAALRELHREAGTSLGLDPSGQRVNSSSTLRLMGVIPRSALRVLALQAGLRLRHEDGVVWLSEGIPTRFAAAPADVPPEWEAVWELRQERWAATGTALGELAGAIAGVTGLPVRCADGVEDATCWVLLQGLPLRAAVRAAATSAGVRVVFEDGALVFKRR